MGAELDDNCAHNPDGDCRCKTGVVGRNCSACADGYYGFGQDPKTGCRSKTKYSCLRVVSVMRSSI